MSFSGLARDWDKMAALLLHKLADNLDPRAEKRSFWKVPALNTFFVVVFRRIS